MPQIQPPRPPQIMPHPPINDLEEDIGGEEIYDIMDEPIGGLTPSDLLINYSMVLETSQPPNIGRLQLKPVIPNGIGMRPPIMVLIVTILCNDDVIYYRENQSHLKYDQILLRP